LKEEREVLKSEKLALIDEVELHKSEKAILIELKKE
jgi:hypothetical protein